MIGTAHHVNAAQHHYGTQAVALSGLISNFDEIQGQRAFALLSAHPLATLWSRLRRYNPTIMSPHWRQNKLLLSPQIQSVLNNIKSNWRAAY